MAAVKPAQGRWDGRTMLVEDPKEAGRLWNRHAIGDMLPGGGMRLSPVEAAHCLVSGWLESRTKTPELLAAPATQQARPLAAHTAGPAGGAASTTVSAPGAPAGAGGADARLEVQFLAYRDLRERGVVVRHDGDGFGVWDRGAAPPQPQAYHVRVSGERDPLAAQDLLQLASIGAVAAVVDDDGEPTYYKVTRADVQGSCPLPEGKVPGRRLADRVVVDAPQAWSERVRPGGRTPLFLSQVEAAALARLGRLELAGARQAMQSPRVAVATDLWKRGVMARSGFRFGTHLRGYRDDPRSNHAEFLVQAAAGTEQVGWTDLSRGVRLAHGVRKRFLVAVVGAEVQYAEVAWFKP